MAISQRFIALLLVAIVLGLTGCQSDVPSDQAIELTFWQSVKGSSDPADYSEYLRLYPNGMFAHLADNRLTALRNAVPVVDAPKNVVASPMPQRSDAPSDKTIELTFWESVKGSSDPADYREYVRLYPNGIFARLANNKLAALHGPGTAVEMPRNVEVPPTPKIGPNGYPAVAGKSFKDCEDGCPDMVVLPAGHFMMGGGRAGTINGPIHAVAVNSPLAVGKTHITRYEFATFVQASGYRAAGGCSVWSLGTWHVDETRTWQNPGFVQTDRDPVVCVNWSDAKAYALWLSERTHKHYRLLREAEWEYAARGNIQGDRYWGDEPADQCRFANGADLMAQSRVPGVGWEVAPCNDGYFTTSPGGSFEPNAFGLYDMLGNAWQWVEDCWQEGYDDAPADTSGPVLSGNCSVHILRGGSWYFTPTLLSASYRYKDSAQLRESNYGFRIARDPERHL